MSLYIKHITICNNILQIYTLCVQKKSVQNPPPCDQLCDAGCVITFDATTVTVTLNDNRILAGVRTPATGLWHLSMVQPSLVPAPPSSSHPMALAEPPLLHQSFAAVQSATPPELVAFAHATLFSPALSTLKKALDRGFLPNFRGITATTLKKYPPIQSQ